MERKKNYKISLIIGTILTIIAVFSPAVSPYNREWRETEFGEYIFFWSFGLKDFNLRFYIAPFGLNIIIFLFLIGCIIYNCNLCISTIKNNTTNNKFAQKTFSIATLMILLTFNLMFLIEYIFITTTPEYSFTGEPWGFYWYYWPNFGLIGVFLGSFIIIFGSLYQMSKVKSKFFYFALVFTFILFIRSIIYLLMPG